MAAGWLLWLGVWFDTAPSAGSSKDFGAAHHERLGTSTGRGRLEIGPCCVSVVVFLGSSMQRPGAEETAAPGPMRLGDHVKAPAEIIFEVTEAVEGGFDARALGYSIFTQETFA